MSIAILALATILRIPFLNQSLWLDESIQALALMGKMGNLLEYALSDFQPPLYHLLLSGWTRIFGFSEISLRFPSFIAGIALVWIGMQLAKVISSKKTSIITGLFLATNPLLIYYSQEGRSYMLTTFFVASSFYFLLKQMTQAKRSNLYLYLLFTTGALYTSYLAWIAVAIQSSYLVMKKRKQLLLYNLFSWTTLLIWAPSVATQLKIGFSTVATSPLWGRLVGGFELMRLPRTWIKFVVGRVSFDNSLLYVLLVTIIFGYHLFSLKFSRFKQRPLITTWLIGSITVGLLISLFIPVYQYFRLLFVLPAYLILLALGVSQHKKWRLHTIVLVSIQLVFLSYFWFTPRFHREDWRTLTTTINAHPDAAVAMPSLAQNAGLKYYLLKNPMIEPKLGVNTTSQQVFYIQYVENIFDIDRIGINNLIDAGYRQTGQESYPGLHLLIFEK